MAIIEVDLAELFQSRFFVIPGYQRLYAWETSHCRALIDDIDAINVSDQQHRRFMGYITTIKPSEPGDRGARFGEGGKNIILTWRMKELARMIVVDGQQRLTTLTLLIGALVNALRESEPQLAAELMANFLITKTVNNQPLLRLNPQEISDDDDARPISDYYTSLLEGVRDAPIREIRIPAVKRMHDAALLFDEYVGRQKQTGLLNELLQKIQGRLLFGLNEEKSLHHASDIFEGLNNRGKPLTDLERVKSHAAYVTGAALQSDSTLDILNHGKFDRESAIGHMNGLIGDIYRTLDAVGMSTAKTEEDLIEAHWPSIDQALLLYDVGYRQRDDNNTKRDGNNTRIEQSSDRLSFATNLTMARKRGKEKSLVAASMDYVASLRDASVFYTDLMRPSGKDAFRKWCDATAFGEIKRLSISLQGQMQESKRFAPVLIAARLQAPDDPDSYLMLLSHLETVAFWGSFVFDSSILRGNQIDRFAEDLAKQERNVEGICNLIRKSLRRARRFKNYLDGSVEGDQLGRRIAREYIKIDNAAAGIIIGEYWNSKRPDIVNKIGSVHRAVKKGHYFNRVLDRPTQPGLGDVDSDTRIQWYQHVSNIIPALGTKQEKLAQEKEGDVADTALLIEAGVAPELICDPLMPETVEGLVESVCDFVARRWPLDDFLQR